MAGLVHAERIKKALGNDYFEFVSRLSERTKIKSDSVLRILQLHGGDLSPGIVGEKIRELGGGAGAKIPLEAASYGLKSADLKDHLAVLKFIQGTPLKPKERGLATEIHRFMWAQQQST